MKFRVLVVIALAACGALLATSSAAAVNFPVDTTADEPAEAPTNDGVCDSDPGPGFRCALRAAIQEANNVAGADSISFTVAGEHGLQSGQLLITQPLTINGLGSGPTGTRIDGGDLDRVFNVNVGVGDTVSFNDVRIQDGAVTTGGTSGGAGILITTAQTVNVDDSVVTSNTVTGTNTPGSGGGILNNNGATTVNVTGGSSVSGNNVGVTSQSSDGGGIYSQGPVVITGSTVDGNTLTGGSGESGAGLAVNSSFQITASTISRNTGAISGGGLQDNSFAAAARSITNSTFSGNAAGTGGGGGAILTSNVSVFHSTFANNTTTGAGADIRLLLNTTTVENSILGSTGACSVPGGTLTSAGHNIQRDASCGFGATGDQTTDPGLAPLALNAPGDTETHALNPGSPAINTADPADCGTAIMTDQRGVARPQPAGGQCDKGSYEVADSDGDGILDTSDNCPTQAGPASNGGCPLPVATPPTVTPLTPTTPASNTAACDALRAKLKKAKSKRKKKKIRAQLRQLGC